MNINQSLIQAFLARSRILIIDVSISSSWLSLSMAFFFLNWWFAITQMPVMDGYSATKAIRESEVNTGRHIPIVALTAHALASDEEKCLSVGMDAYLTKPINCKQLVSTVKELVKR
jgi:CheY-like chemotaxis protein